MNHKWANWTATPNGGTRHCKRCGVLHLLFLRVGARGGDRNEYGDDGVAVMPKCPLIPPEKHEQPK